MLLKIVLAAALMASCALAVCNPGKAFNDDTGAPCPNPAAAKARRADAPPHIATEDGHVYVYSAGGNAPANLTDMQSATEAAKTFDEHGSVQRRAAVDVAAAVQELVDTNKAVLAASAKQSADALTANAAQMKGVVAAVGTVVTALDAIRKEQKEVAQSVANSTQSAAASGGCIPYVEYTVKGGCKLLSYACDKMPGTWEKARPTRTTDRTCAAWTACELKKTYEAVKGTSYSDRKCVKVKVCDAKKGESTLKEATLTEDRTCGTFGQTKESAIESCNVLLSKKKDLKGKNGWFWIKPKGQEALKTYCDMTTEGGGWTMFGRGKGGGSNQRCWRTAGACYKQDLGNTNMAWNNANTAKFSDAWVNAMTYTRIRFSGSNYIKVNWYWRGKDQSGGGCTYKHTVSSDGRCNCASRQLNMGNQQCGSRYPTHRGVGDWPHAGGCLHSTHYNEGWYIKQGTGCGNGHCSGNGANNARCDVQLWVR